MSVRHYLGLVAIAFSVTYALTPLVRGLSARLGLLDAPGGRRVHTREVSRLGGAAIFGGFCAAMTVQYLGERFAGWGAVFARDGWPLAGTFAGMIVIMAVGLWDDVRPIPPGVKLAGQIVAASLPLAAGLRVDYVGNPFGGGLIQLGLLGIPVTLAWIVGFTNVINLIDGLDGLAAGVTAIAALSFLVLAAQMNQLAAAVLAAALIGACIGFLRYNFHPASIHMGDSGAMFLGFTLSTLALQGVMKSVAAITLLVPLLVIGVPVFDTLSAIIRRTRHGRPIQEADDGHIHHRLLRRGLSHRQTVLVIYVWSAALAAGGYSMRFVPSAFKVGVFVVLAALSALMASRLGLFDAARVHGDDRSSEVDEGF
ncbi:MAG: MraY family glycosyltransferase [Coriobacteriia bacterium]|nr:MraY family glycosyltransferase [Coriobacteriia bacterium]